MLRAKSIQFVNAPQNCGRCYMGGVIPNLGLLSIASFLKKVIPKIDIEILEGELLSQEQIENKINADIIGLSVNFFNYLNSLKIAKLAKNKGLTVIVGGVLATAIPEIILKNREYIDFIVIGQGEHSILSYIQGRKLKDIENLVYREKGFVRTNNLKENGKIIPKEYSIDSLAEIDYDFVPMEKFWNNFEKAYPRVAYRFAPVCTHKGCKWRKKQTCLFCSIMDSKLRYINPIKFWNFIDKLVNQYKVDFIRDVGDSITGNLCWLKTLVRERPRHLKHLKFFLYSRVDELLSPGVIDLLEELNTHMIFVGFESGNKNSLTSFNKGISIQQNFEAAHLLVSKNIKLLASFVLGAQGETDKSVADTVRFAHYLKDLFKNNLEVMNTNLLIPYPGSKAFYVLAEKYPHYLREDLFNPTQLTKEWLENFCNLSGEKDQWWTKLNNITKELDHLGKHSNLMLSSHTSQAQQTPPVTLSENSRTVSFQRL